MIYSYPSFLLIYDLLPFFGRYDAHSGGEREIQRTMLELLNQLDGFDSRGDVKVILATNRIESLDPALLRPGRIDRKIEFPLPDIKTRRRIFQVLMDCSYDFNGRTEIIFMCVLILQKLITFMSILLLSWSLSSSPLFYL